MSKSLGNIIRLPDVKHNKFLLRMYWFTKSYRQTFDYCEESIEKLKVNFKNLHMLYNKMKYNLVLDKTNSNNKNVQLLKREIYWEILQNVSHDFDTGKALINLNKYVDIMLKQYMDNSTRLFVLEQLDKINQLFNLLDTDILEIKMETFDKINQRDQLRKLKMFKEADNIRLELNKNYLIEDNSTGYSIIRNF
jgi:cysteinyl-tRNA synthetase